MADTGYRKMIITPHIISSSFHNTPEGILSGLEGLKKKIAENKIDIELDAASEYYLDTSFIEKIKDENILSFGKKKYVLFETQVISFTPLLFKAIFLLQTNGFIPVLAHPERYHYLQNDLSLCRDLKSKGVLFQMNIISLHSTYTPEARKTAEKLIVEELVDFVGSDIHSIRYVSAIQSLKENKFLYQLLESGKLLNPTL
jgi:tyrosine-protein phosphatase YwqE